MTERLWASRSCSSRAIVNRSSLTCWRASRLGGQHRSTDLRVGGLLVPTPGSHRIRDAHRDGGPRDADHGPGVAGPDVVVDDEARHVEPDGDHGTASAIDGQRSIRTHIVDSRTSTAKMSKVGALPDGSRARRPT